jgi:hypothetical protein
MKYVKTFEDFQVSEGFQQLNETVYSTGLGGNLKYASGGSSSAKSKTLSILKSGKWKNTPAGKFALEQADEIAKRWNDKDPAEKRPGWFKDYTVDKEGKLEAVNFISKTAVIAAVLDEITKSVEAEWIGGGGARNQCFGNASKWFEETGGKAIGGICMKKDDIGKYYAESLIVHAFGEKNGKYYEMTFPSETITKNIIYWPLITFVRADEKKISEDIWSYALGIEEAVKEHFGIKI